MRRVLIIAALLTVGLSAWGQSNGTIGFTTTGNDLIEACHPGNALELLACYSYIHGVLDGFAAGGVWNTTQRVDGSGVVKGVPCVPDGVTNGELVKVILLYADKHPAGLHNGASGLITLAVRDAWGSASPEHPCQ